MATIKKPVHVYVDTCVLSAAANRELPPAEHAAMNTIDGMVQSSAVTLSCSPLVLEEMSRIPDPHFARHIQQYHVVGKVSSLLTWEEYNPATEITDFEVEDEVYEALRELLPHENDAQHLAQAKLGGMDHVLTLDARTILRYAPDLRDRFGLMVFKPSEFVAWFSGVSG